MEGSVFIIFPRAEEIVQHLIVIGCTNEMPHGQAHLHRIPACKNIPEVPCRYSEIQLLAVFDFAHAYRLQICPEIVNNLRHQSADVDGVRRRKLESLRRQLLLQLLIRKNALYRRLRIIKVPLNADHAGIRALLRIHLQLLHGTDPILREEYHNSCTLHVRKALQCRLACITACRSQNHNLLLQAVPFRRSFHQIGQYRKCHILKCQCSPVE